MEKKKRRMSKIELTYKIFLAPIIVVCFIPMIIGICCIDMWCNITPFGYFNEDDL